VSYAGLKQAEGNTAAMTADELWVLSLDDVIFGVRHQAKYEAGGVADASDVGNGSVGVGA
jgi:hypothetical protein